MNERKKCCRCRHSSSVVVIKRCSDCGYNYGATQEDMPEIEQRTIGNCCGPVPITRADFIDAQMDVLFKAIGHVASAESVHEATSRVAEQWRQLRAERASAIGDTGRP